MKKTDMTKLRDEMNDKFFSFGWKMGMFIIVISLMNIHLEFNDKEFVSYEHFKDNYYVDKTLSLDTKINCFAGADFEKLFIDGFFGSLVEVRMWQGDEEGYCVITKTNKVIALQWFGEEE